MMQLANILLALGGDKDNTVPKTMVTPAEIAVLQYVHGNESVSDIEPYGQVDRAHRAERQRLLERYGRMDEGRLTSKAVEALFPGAAARVYETFAELELPEEFYKAASRVTNDGKANAVVEEALPVEEVVHPLDHDANGKKGGAKKANKAADPAPAAELPVVEDSAGADDPDAEDGIEDMAEDTLFK